MNRLEAFHLLLRQTSFIQKDHWTSSAILQRKVGSKSRSSSHVTKSKESAALLRLFFQRFHRISPHRMTGFLPILVLHVIVLFGSECTFKDLFSQGGRWDFNQPGWWWLRFSRIAYWYKSKLDTSERLRQNMSQLINLHVYTCIIRYSHNQEHFWKTLLFLFNREKQTL